jgi:hypothetical protein
MEYGDGDGDGCVSARNPPTATVATARTDVAVAVAVADRTPRLILLPTVCYRRPPFAKFLRWYWFVPELWGRVVSR